jgi:hypothetical protein
MSDKGYSEKDLLRQAILLYDDGDKTKAQFVLRVASEMSPRSEIIWLWRAGVSETRSEAVGYLEQVLMINPKHAVAKAWKQRFLENGVSDSIAALEAVGEPGISPEHGAGEFTEKTDQSEPRAISDDPEIKQVISDAIDRTKKMIA